MQAVGEINLNRSRWQKQHFAVLFFLLALSAFFFISWQPLQLSILTIFLFAGLHNFMEFRYFLARMPIFWGKSRNFYAVGIGGTVLLTVSYLMIYFGFHNWLWSDQTSAIAVASWNTAFALWVASLFYLRGKQKPKTDWTLAFAIGLFIAALAWLIPHYWSFALIYLHPCIAFWFFDRQLRRSQPSWRKTYHLGLALVALLTLSLWIFGTNLDSLPENNDLALRITQHAGASVFPNISTHVLVATHVFLETIHYSIWILFIPLVDKKAIPWKLTEIPLFNHRQGFPKLITSALALSVLLVLLLWLGFSANYSLTRDIYFAFAIAHVLAEFPFLIKML